MIQSNAMEQDFASTAKVNTTEHFVEIESKEQHLLIKMKPDQ